MFFFIQISSKSKETLKLFLNFINKFDNNNLNLTIKYFPKQKIKKFITVLKSPHVNKSAQEQFEFKIYTKKLYINSVQHLKFLYFLKKLQNNIFPFINLKIEGNYDVKSQFKSILNPIEPNRMNVSFFSLNMINKKDSNNENYLKLLINYLNLLDCNGEYHVKNFLTKNIKHL